MQTRRAAVLAAAEAVTANVGTVDRRSAVRDQRALLTAFFDRWLRGLDDRGLLDGPLPRHPELRFFS